MCGKPSIAHFIQRCRSRCCAANNVNLHCFGCPILSQNALVLPSLVQGPSDEPVWRQLLQLYVENSDPDVAQQAAAALAE